MSDEVYLSRTVVPVVAEHVEAISLMPSPRELVSDGPYGFSQRLRLVYERMANTLKLLREGLIPKNFFDVMEGEAGAVGQAWEAVRNCAFHVDDFSTPFAPAQRAGGGIVVVAAGSVPEAGPALHETIRQLDLRGQLARLKLLGVADANDVARVQRYFDPVCRELFGITPFVSGALGCLVIGFLVFAGINSTSQS